VDIAQDEIGRNRSVDLGVVSDVKTLLAELNGIIGEKKMSKVLQEQYNPGSNRPEGEKDGKEQAKSMWECNTLPMHPMRLRKKLTRLWTGRMISWLSMAATRRPGWV